jgi:hypothetical protein
MFKSRKSIFWVVLLTTSLFSYALEAQEALDTLFGDLAAKEIDATEYAEKFSKWQLKDVETRAKISQFFLKNGLQLEHECDEICESYLISEVSQERKYLPGNFDQGVLGIVYSPNLEQCIVYASYDGPDYDRFYYYRSEFSLFGLKDTIGLDAFTLEQSFTETICSIEEIIWVDDEQIALKVYEEGRWGDGSHLTFRYFILQLP